MNPTNSTNPMNPTNPQYYPPTTWRLLITPPTDGATNMAIDEAVLYALAEGDGWPTLRFYKWEPACLTLGYNQKWAEVDVQTIEQAGYTWTRRATGGRAILHTDELTYSLIIPQEDPRVQGGITESYRTLSFGLINGLSRLGITANQATRDEVKAALRQKRRGGPVCFDTPSHYEITWQGKKLIGSAQLRRKQMVLQHGTLPLRGDLNRILQVLTFSNEERQLQQTLLPQRATTLEQVLGQILSFDEVVEALTQGFSNELNLFFTPMPLSSKEETLAQQLRTTQYANNNWVKRV